jgi:dimethylglycine dehydrogenase
MGYVTPDASAPGTILSVMMQGQLWTAEVTQDSPYDPKNEVIRKDG